ncbi:hypothetical protein [Streptosporangium pseudovulgare]|uniref:Lipoprotein n=1 Tax=Streptosporangium pseudovulgare TaxID=35765 RepID=A0ABQ2QML8_9ACTN|nr:hypothetical protein [Streptosporangium pseudovulgare]GGP87117.1 putative lipoprotein [Streptosporangium pseudovulgare]
MRAHRRRGPLALALALVTCAAACSGPGDQTPLKGGMPPGSTPTPAAPAEPPVTLAEADDALAGVLDAEGVLSGATPHLAADRRYMLAQTCDAQQALSSAAFNVSAGAPPHHTWGRPRLLVPRVQRAPYWFAAVVSREDSAGGSRTAVLTLTERDDRWCVSSTALLEPGERVPEIARDAEGYATALDQDDRSVEISPRLMAPLHATAAEQGTQGIAAGLVEKGRRTTGYAEEIAAERKKYKADDCQGYDSIFGASGYPVRALRTADGGAMVMYSLIRTDTLTVKVVPCAMIRVPKHLERLVSGSNLPVKELRIVETQPYVSVVPRRNAHGPARVIAYLGAVTKVFGT